MSARTCDVAVVGAGFGGLGAALELASRGARVVVCETLGYPGGCASTWTRGAWRFESGATLFSGFGEGQLFRRWIDEHRMPVRFVPLDPVAELRLPDRTLAVPPDRDAFVARLCALPGAPVEGLRRFFALQARVADALWPLLDDPGLLPPLGPAALWRHALRAGSYLPLASLVGRPVLRAMERCGVDGFAPFRAWADATCQITVQAPAAEAEAPFALAAMDYWFRGTGHVDGGVGRLAEGLAEAIRARGGEVLYTERVKGLARDGDGWTLTTRRRTLRARAVVANVLPAALSTLAGPGPRGRALLDRLDRAVRTGWGAAMLYLGVEGDGLPSADAGHLSLVADPAAPFVEGNHVFCSLSAAGEADRAPAGHRTVTASTHVRMDRLLALAPEARGPYVQAVQDRMRETLARRAPELAARVVTSLPASPRTYERYTGRPDGFVGGVPRRAGLAGYRLLGPLEVEDGLWLVGDSTFPGQSTLATAVGGARVAEAVVRRLGAAPAALPRPADVRPS